MNRTVSINAIHWWRFPLGSGTSLRSWKPPLAADTGRQDQVRWHSGTAAPTPQGDCQCPLHHPILTTLSCMAFARAANGPGSLSPRSGRTRSHGHGGGYLKHSVPPS